MSFSRYAPDDSVISAESVIRPMWTGDQYTLSSFFTASGYTSPTYTVGDIYLHFYYCIHIHHYYNIQLISYFLVFSINSLQNNCIGDALDTGACFLVERLELFLLFSTAIFGVKFSIPLFVLLVTTGLIPIFIFINVIVIIYN